MDQRPDRGTRALAIVAVLLTAVVLVGARAGWAWLRGPAPWPPEWQWGFAPKPWDARVLPALLCAGALVGLVAAARWLSTRASTIVSALALTTLLGFALQLALLHVEPEGAVAELVRRTARGSFTSYHRVALSSAAEDPRAFLAQHADLLPALRKGTPHAATHPPGAVLYFRAWLGLARMQPRLAATVASWCDRAGLDLSTVQPPLEADGAASALLGAATLGLVGAAAGVPLFLLLRRLGAPADAALAAAGLWALTPGLVLMVPELDQALAFPVVAAAALLAGGGLVRALLAGAVVGAALFFSYGVAVPAAIGMAAVLLAADHTWRERAALALACAAGAAAVFAAPALFGHQPVTALMRALAIHHDQFTAPRRWSTWLAWGPLDLILFAGIPVALSLAWRAATRPAPFARTVLAGTLLLFLSGSVRGEVGRILVPLMPLLLAAALPRSDGEPWPVHPVLAAVLLAATDVVLRVSWQLP